MQAGASIKVRARVTVAHLLGPSGTFTRDASLSTSSSRITGADMAVIARQSRADRGVTENRSAAPGTYRIKACSACVRLTLVGSSSGPTAACLGPGKSQR